MLDSTLKYWVAESGSWQSFIEFDLAEDSIADYDFLKKTDDFFLSLMYKALKAIKTEESEEIAQEEILALAKGLEIYSLKKKRDSFSGVSHSNNILFAATLYYLSNYSASAWILSKIYPFDSYKSSIDHFNSAFLRRELNNDNIYSVRLKLYLETGNVEVLKSLLTDIETQIKIAFETHSHDYTSFLLAKSLVKKFSSDNIWNDLLSLDDRPEYWKPIVKKNINKKVPVWSLFPSQRRALAKGVLSKNSYSLQMPTSSGKTSLCELIVYNEIKNKQSSKILYLAPFRALASELKSSLATNLGQLGIKSKTIYGGHVPTVEERNSIQDAELIIATPEKFMAIEDVFPNIQDDFDTIICDEGHLLDDNSRGLSYELLLSRLKNNQNSKKKFIFISAIIPNIEVINAWLGGNEETLVTSNYRPTELEYSFLNKMQTKTVGYFLDINPTKSKPNNYQLYKYLSESELKLKINNSNSTYKVISKKGLSVAASLKATKSGSVALFAPHKRGHSGVEGIAQEAIKQLGTSNSISLLAENSINLIDSLIEYFTIIFGEDYLLIKALKKGFLYHHGDFPQGIREIIEDALRSGQVKFVICTNTLAEGVNLPIKTMVIHSTKRFNPNVSGNYERLKKRDIKNLVGRAGRAGKETKGLVIIPHSEDFDVIKDLITETNIEPVKGQLFNIIQLITNALSQQRLTLTGEILDELDDYFQTLLDSVDLSMIDLLAEEVRSDNLSSLIQDLISQTLSYYQSDDAEKETLNTLYSIRANKMVDIIDAGEFALLKKSGATLRLYNDIKEHINLESEAWLNTQSALDEIWLNYILEDCVFHLTQFKNALANFNNENNTSLNLDQIKQVINLWMNGFWYGQISSQLNLEIYQVLRLLNSFISFQVQSIISTIIRLKELSLNNEDLPSLLINWPSLLQHGISSQQALDLFEMGLSDRVTVLNLEQQLSINEYDYQNYDALRLHLITNKELYLNLLSNELPKISFNKAQVFFDMITIRAIR